MGLDTTTVGAEVADVGPELPAAGFPSGICWRMSSARAVVGAFGDSGADVACAPAKLGIAGLGDRLMAWIFWALIVPTAFLMSRAITFFSAMRFTGTD